jgi:hypothetical protein
LFPGLSTLLIDGVVATGSVLRITSRSAKTSRSARDAEPSRVECMPSCAAADRLPVAGRTTVVDLRVRRLLFSDTGCPQRTFREQILALAHRYVSRTVRLAATIGQATITLAGRPDATLLGKLGVTVSRSSLLRALEALPHIKIIPLVSFLTSFIKQALVAVTERLAAWSMQSRARWRACGQSAHRIRPTRQDAPCPPSASPRGSQSR